MPRIIAIDYGKRRCGLAVTDPLQLIAGGLTTVSTKELMPFLTDYFQKEEVCRLVIGYPLNSYGGATDSTPLIDEFLATFAKKFPQMPITKIDEAFTSQEAVAAMIAGGLKKKKRRNKAQVDKISATLILQRYMEQNS